MWKARQIEEGRSGKLRSDRVVDCVIAEVAPSVPAKVGDQRVREPSRRGSTQGSATGVQPFHRSLNIRCPKQSEVQPNKFRIAKALPANWCQPLIDRCCTEGPPVGTMRLRSVESELRLGWRRYHRPVARRTAKS